MHSSHAADESICAQDRAMPTKPLTTQPLNSDFAKGIVCVARDSS